MIKLLRSLVPVVLACFVITFALPLPARADDMKAIDNDHVTYRVDTHGDVRADHKFKLSISAMYDKAPITDLAITNPKGFQMINSKGSGEFEMRAPFEGDKAYGLQMEGMANGQKVDFTAFVRVLNKNQEGTGGNPAFTITMTVILVAVVAVAIGALIHVMST
jgi:hypothetical protein